MKIRIKDNAAEISRKFLPNGPMAGVPTIKSLEGKELKVSDGYPKTVFPIDENTVQPKIEYYDVYTPAGHVIAVEAELVVTKKDLLVEKIQNILKKDV